jgi:guanine nucleotide-binding protein G(o) subunit alpha
MGLCGSKREMSKEEVIEKQKSKDIEKQMHSDQRAEQEVHKLLLLGAGESGKSTLFKQMITIYGKGFPESERRTFTPIIYSNVISSTKTLVQQSETYGNVSGDNEAAKQLIDQLIGDEEIDEKLGEQILALWNDAGIQKTYDNRAKYQLTDSTAYFMDRLPEIMQQGYIPTEQDVLRSRVRTTGIVENEFLIDGNRFKMFDVGGQRNERKKWIHCFENVTAVIFVAAISEYDQYLYEDENTNRMHEALNLFDSICNSRWFAKTSLILFLNKCDLFAEKIKKVPITTAFPDYSGAQEYDESIKYIEGQFQNLNKNPDKQIYCHVTCATDTKLVAAVFNAVKDIIIRNSLRDAGLN